MLKCHLLLPSVSPWLLSVPHPVLGHHPQAGDELGLAGARALGEDSVDVVGLGVHRVGGDGGALGEGLRLRSWKEEEVCYWKSFLKKHW